MAYQVKAPLVQAKTAEGGYVHVYEGGFLPEDQDPVQLEQMLESGMVAEADAPEPPASDEGDEPKPRGRRSK